jgi:hypothetical protein
MRCLYCAKQLPLLKRLTKGEFCSAAHRKQYQLEYSQLALSRLLRAKPPEESQHTDEQPPRGSAAKETKGSRAAPVSKPAGNGKSAADTRTSAPSFARTPGESALDPSPLPQKYSPAPAFSAWSTRSAALKPANAADSAVALADAPSATRSIAALAESVEQAIPETARALVADPAPMAAIETAPVIGQKPVEPTRVEPTSVGLAPVEPAPVLEAEITAPAALAGPVKLCPPAPNAKGCPPARAVTEIQFAGAPEIPRPGIVPPIVNLDPAPRVSYLPVPGPATSPWRSRVGRVESREFGHATPPLQLVTALTSPRMEAAAVEPAKITFAPLPSRTAAALRSEPHKDFRGGPIEAGEIAVLDLATTGFEYSEAELADAAPADAPVKPPEKTPQVTTFSPAPVHENSAPQPPAAVPVAAPPAEAMVTPQSLAEVENSLTKIVSRLETIARQVEVVSVETRKPEPPHPSEAVNPAGSLHSLATRVAELETKAFKADSASVPVEASAVIPTASVISTPAVVSTPGPMIEAPIAAEKPAEVPAIPESAAAQPAPVVQQTRGVETGSSQPTGESQASLETPRARDTDRVAPVTESSKDREPARVTQPMPIALAGVPAGKAKAQQIFTSTLKADVNGQIPRYETLPLRPTMIVAREAAAPKTETVKAEAGAKAATKAVAPAQTEPAVAGTAESATPPAEPQTKPTAAPQAKPAENVSAPVMAETAATAAPAKTQPAAAPQAPKAPALAEAPKPAAHQSQAPAPNPSQPQAMPEKELVEVNREQAKLNREQAELNRAQAELNREQARRNRELAKTAEKIAASTISGAPFVGAGPKEKAGSLTSLSLSGPPPVAEEADLGLPVLDLEAAKQRSTAQTKLLVAAACAVLLGVGVWFSTRTVSKGPETPMASSVSGGAGPEWREDFSPDAKHPRTISILKASEAWTDYSVEFNASVDVKALGWVFRAKDPQNFYVGRIEQEKTASGVSAAFIYFPVLNGVAQTHKRSNVTLPAAPGTVYRIRFDVFGDQFTAWIQDRKVEEWTDSRLRTGGAGLYSESGERALLQGAFRVIPRTPGR